MRLAVAVEILCLAVCMCWSFASTQVSQTDQKVNMI